MFEKFIILFAIMERGGHVYIMTNKHHTVFYTGVSAELTGRVFEHKHKVYPQSFTARYNIFKLVFYEFHDTIEEAIAREKQIKGWSRQKKIQLIEKHNKSWRDLFDELE